MWRSSSTSYASARSIERVKLVAVVAADAAECVLAAMQDHPHGRYARVIGRVVAEHAGMVLIRTQIGGTRMRDVLFHEPLPRSCRGMCAATRLPAGNPSGPVY